MNIKTFYEKLNKIEGNVYAFEEQIVMNDGAYEGELQHDNINNATLAVYTGPKLTGDRIRAFVLSTPSLTPWKRSIRIYAESPEVYISYETEGDTVEAEDVNLLQDEVTRTQEAVNEEEARAGAYEAALRGDITAETIRAKGAEKVLTDNLGIEKSRSQAMEQELQGNIDAHTTATDSEIAALRAKDADLDTSKASVVYVNQEVGKRYTKEQVYTKAEVLQKIEDLIGTAPDTLDTFKEIAEALGNDPNFASTIMNALAAKVDKADGKQLTSNDYSNSEKEVVADVNAKKHTHSNKSILDAITQALLDNWSAAFAHISSKANPHAVTKAHVGLGTVEDKTGAVIRGEMTKDEVIKALGYTPPTSSTGYTHPNSGVTAGTYRSVIVNAQGHVTAGTNPTTLAGYGITDAMKKGPITWNDLKGV